MNETQTRPADPHQTHTDRTRTGGAWYAYCSNLDCDFHSRYFKAERDAYERGKAHEEKHAPRFQVNP